MIQVEWFGARAAAHGTPAHSLPIGVPDAHRAIQAACDAAFREGGGVVRLGPGRYLVEGTIAVPRGVILEGEGLGASVLWVRHTGDAITLSPPPPGSPSPPYDAHYATSGIRDLTAVVDPSWPERALTPPRCLLSMRGQALGVIRDVFLHGPALYGCFVSDSIHTTIERLSVHGAVHAGVFVQGHVHPSGIRPHARFASGADYPAEAGVTVTTLRFRDCRFHGTGGGCGASVGGLGIVFDGCVFESNAVSGLTVRWGTVDVHACYFEANPDDLRAGVEPYDGNNATLGTSLVVVGSSHQPANPQVPGAAIRGFHLFSGAVVGSRVSQRTDRIDLGPNGGRNEAVKMVGVQENHTVSSTVSFLPMGACGETPVFGGPVPPLDPRDVVLTSQTDQRR